MWRNKGGRFAKRGGFSRGKGTQFSRNNQRFRGSQKRDYHRESDRSRFDDNFQTNADHNSRGFREESANFDQRGYGRSELENRGDNFVDPRDSYQVIQSENSTFHDDYQDNVVYGDQDDRRNVVEETRGFRDFVNKDNDLYYEDRGAHSLGDMRNRDRDFRTDEYYNSTGTFEFTIDTSARFEGDLRNNLNDLRENEQIQQRHEHDVFRERRMSDQHHHSDSDRKNLDHRSNYGRDVHSHSGRDGRKKGNLSRERFEDKKSSYKAIEGKRRYDDKRNNSRSADRTGNDKRRESARSGSSDRKKGGNKTSVTSKDHVSKLDRNTDNTKEKVETTLKIDHKKSEQKSSNQSENLTDTKSTKTTKSRDKNSNDKNKKTTKSHDSSKNDQIKHGSDKKHNASSSHKKGEDRKQSTSISRAESSSFKKPGDKHSSRQRSNSGRKLESDSGHFDDADILSIMADDDGFEKEMKAFSSTGEHHRSQSRTSRERGCDERMSRSHSSLDRTFERQHHSRDRKSKEKQEYSKRRGSNERQQHSRDRENKNESRHAFDKNFKTSTSTFGSGQTFKDNLGRNWSGRIQGDNKPKETSSSNRLRTNFNRGQRLKDNRQGFRPTGRNNNNNLVGRSRFSAASKIKDSYFKRKNTFQGVLNKRFDNGNKPLFKHNQPDISVNLRYGKSEVGVTGAVLKDDRISENKASPKFKGTNRVSQGFDHKIENKFDRGFDKFSYSKNINRNVKGSRFQREGVNVKNRDRFTNMSFKSREVASQRVKQKYLKGGFSQNRNNNRGFLDGRGKYDRRKKETNKNWDRRPVEDKEKSADVIQDDISNSPLPLDDQALELNSQQVIFIPSSDLQSSQPHMVDQFGQIIINQVDPEMDVQQGEEALPLQYIPQQFHHSDRVPQGEQVVFIPFVNNQGQPDYSGNLPVTFNDNTDSADVNKAMPEKKQGGNMASSGSKISSRKKKPLSVQARAKLKKSLEIKRKQRMEKEIEKKLLKKLLSNPDVNKVVRESTIVKKKPLIKRISPPSSSNQSNKQYKLVKRDNETCELDDVSEDEAKYDNVSDLEDVSDNEDVYEVNDEYDTRQGKRPVFRKPGQPRINKNVSSSSTDVLVSSTSGDVRRVVNNSSMKQGRRGGSQSNNRSPRMNQVESVNKFKQNDKSRRSVYIENPTDNVESNMVKKRTSCSTGYESNQIKKHRSISPIEITVSNDRFSKGTYKISGSGNSDGKFDFSNRNDERKSNYRQNYSDERNFRDRFDRTNESPEEYEKGDNEIYKVDIDGKNQRYGRDRSGRIAEKSSRDENTFRKDGNNPGSDTDEKRRDKDQRDKGKYYDKKGSRRDDSDDNRNRKNENYKKHVRDRREESSDEKWRDDSNRRGATWQGRYDRNERRKEKGREYERNDRKGSFGRDANLPDERNPGHKKIRLESGSDDNQDHGTIRSIQGNTFASKMNQPQFQINHPMMQQSMQSQPFITSQSTSISLQGQPMMQFSNSGSSVDHSLPPVQNSPMSMPPFPQHGIGVRPDMSLPPPVMNVIGTPTSMGTMVIQQHPQFQHQQQQMNIQQQPVQQFQNMQPQFQQQQQQQFQQMQSQPQMIQQTNSSNFQTNQPAFQTNLSSNQQMSLQQMQTGQFQQTQSGVNMIPVNQGQQTGSMNQGQRGSNQQSISTSGTIQHYVAATPQQGVRGVIGAIKPSVDNSKMVRGQSVRTGFRNQVSNSQSMQRRQGSKRRSNYSPSGSYGSYHQGEDENDVDEDEYMEMLCSKCDKVFLSHEVMRRHGNWHDKVESNTKSWRCDHCEQGFLSLLSHTDHMSVKHSIDSWNCSLCDMTFSSSFALNSHVRLASHKDLKVKFVCSLCPASFMVLTHLVQHKKENHQSNAGYSFLRKY